MSVKHACPCSEGCPMQDAMAAIGGKWKLPILCSLIASGPTRYNELRRKVKGISNTMLTQCLKELERDGLVQRREYMEVPVRVEYEATEAANDLIPIIRQLAGWSMSLGSSAQRGRG